MPKIKVNLDVEELKARMNVKDGAPGKDGSPDSPEQIVDKLESIKALPKMPVFKVAGEDIGTGNLNLVGGKNIKIKGEKTDDGVTVDFTGIDRAVEQFQYGSAWGAISGEVTDQTDLVEYVADYVDTHGGGTPGGADTQIQFNDGGSFGGDSAFTYDKTNNNVGLNRVDANITDIPLDSSNWTLPTGWAFGTGTIDKTGNGAGTATCTTFTPTAGTQYKLSITFSSFTASTITSIKCGGVVLTGSPNTSGEVVLKNPIIDTAGTYEYVFYAQNTTQVSIAGNNVSRFVISDVTITEFVSDTGQVIAEGELNAKYGSVRIGQTLITPTVRYFTTSSTLNNLSFGGLKPRFVEFTLASSTSITGLDLDQEDGQEIYLFNFSGVDMRILHQDSGSTDVNRIQTSSNTDMAMEYGSVIFLKYSAGTLNRWQAYKFGTGATQFNGYTNGMNFGDWLGTLVSNGTDPVNIYSGNATQLTLIESTKTSSIGDTQNNNNRTKIVIDDNATLIKAYISGYGTGSEFVIYDSNDDKKVFQMKAGDGNFNTRELDLNSRTLVVDKNNGDPDPINDSALLEVRSDGSDVYRGFLPPRMSATNRDGISSPANGLMVYVNDAGAEGISTYDTTNSVWITDYKSRFTVSSLPTVSTQGDRAWVTDESGSGFGNTATGGGSLILPVFFDGTNWIVG